MTQEEKAQAYDEALEKAKIEINTKGIGETVNLCEQLFPELRESEDEGIRKSLIKFLTAVKVISESGRTTWAVRKEDAEMCKSFIAWLEKQKEPENVSASTMIPSCWEVKQKEQKPVNYDAELKKCKDNPLYFFDKYVSIKQKPMEWSEEDEGELQNAIDALEFLGKKGVYRSESGYDAALQAASWLKSLSERFNLQRKVEWSEEDKKMLNHLIDKIQENLNIRMPDGYSFGISNDEKETFSSWLRCLPERFNLSPKNEWSEEDEEMLEYVIGDVNDAKQLFTTKAAINLCDKEIAWLKSLRPQYHGDVTVTEAYKMGLEAGKASSWKPSEEQMDSLRDTIANTKGYSYSIYLPELYEQLKKLV